MMLKSPERETMVSVSDTTLYIAVTAHKRALPTNHHDVVVGPMTATAHVVELGLRCAIVHVDGGGKSISLLVTVSINLRRAVVVSSTTGHPLPLGGSHVSGSLHRSICDAAAAAAAAGCGCCCCHCWQMKDNVQSVLTALSGLSLSFSPFPSLSLYLFGLALSLSDSISGLFGRDLFPHVMCLFDTSLSSYVDFLPTHSFCVHPRSSSPCLFSSRSSRFLLSSLLLSAVSLFLFSTPHAVPLCSSLLLTTCCCSAFCCSVVSVLSSTPQFLLFLALQLLLAPLPHSSTSSCSESATPRHHFKKHSR